MLATSDRSNVSGSRSVTPPPNGIVAPHTAVQNESSVTIGSTRAQQLWLRLFEQPHHHNYHRQEAFAPAVSLLPGSLPIIGGDYDFIVPQAWPSNIVHLANNVFSASQAYPVSKRYSRYIDDCDCDGLCCIADGGTRASSSCINVNQDIVCDDSLCAIGPGCGNRMVQRYHLDLITTRVGLGVVCSVAIPKDSFIIEYVGEVLLQPDAQKRSDRRYLVAMKAKSAWNGPTDVFIDAARGGNESRFINHSCSPNCSLYELEWTNTSRLGIFAKSDIPPLRELTFKYNQHTLSTFTCECGQKNCVSNRS